MTSAVLLLVRWWWEADNGKVTDVGRRAVAEGVRRNPSLALKELYGMDLRKFDDTLPANVAADSNNTYNEAVLSYYRDQTAHGTTTVCKFRVVVVGESGVGKTTLCRKLATADIPAPTSSTHGIETSCVTRLCVCVCVVECDCVAGERESGVVTVLMFWGCWCGQRRGTCPVDRRTPRCSAW